MHPRSCFKTQEIHAACAYFTSGSFLKLPLHLHTSASGSKVIFRQFLKPLLHLHTSASGSDIIFQQFPLTSSTSTYFGFRQQHNFPAVSSSFFYIYILQLPAATYFSGSFLKPPLHLHTSASGSDIIFQQFPQTSSTSTYFGFRQRHTFLAVSSNLFYIYILRLPAAIKFSSSFLYIYILLLPAAISFSSSFLKPLLHLHTSASGSNIIFQQFPQTSSTSAYFGFRQLPQASSTSTYFGFWQRHNVPVVSSTSTYFGFRQLPQASSTSTYFGFR